MKAKKCIVDVTIINYTVEYTFIKQYDEYTPLFEESKAYLQDLIMHLRSQLHHSLSSLASYPSNLRFKGKSLIIGIAYTMEHIKKAILAFYPLSTKSIVSTYHNRLGDEKIVEDI